MNITRQYQEQQEAMKKLFVFMSPLIYGLSESALTCPIYAFCEKVTGDIELISNENSYKSTDSCMGRGRRSDYFSR